MVLIRNWNRTKCIKNSTHFTRMIYKSGRIATHCCVNNCVLINLKHIAADAPSFVIFFTFVRHWTSPNQFTRVFNYHFACNQSRCQIIRYFECNDFRLRFCGGIYAYQLQCHGYRITLGHEYVIYKHQLHLCAYLLEFGIASLLANYYCTVCN